METIGIRELKTHLSRYMKMVKSGQRIIVTDRKKEIAVIMPVEKTGSEEKLYQMVQNGKAYWAGGRPVGPRRRIALNGGTVSDAVIEDRR